MNWIQGLNPMKARTRKATAQVTRERLQCAWCAWQGVIYRLDTSRVTNGARVETYWLRSELLNRKATVIGRLHTYILMDMLEAITVAARFKALKLFVRSNTGIVDSNSTRKHGCLSAFLLCLLTCVGSGLVTGLIPRPRSPTDCLLDSRFEINSDGKQARGT
jgi:hypothetical protein